LLRSHGDVAAFLATTREAFLHILLDVVAREPILGSISQVIDYLRLEIAHERVEQMRVLFLDVHLRLLSSELVYRGGISKVDAHPREIVRRALDLGSTRIILAHNHPSGDPLPSTEDIVATQRVIEAADLFDIVIQDHIIMSRSGWTSCRAAGLLG
jgi:DNA repair protein RadC